MCMWDEKIIKTIPVILFLFCLLEIFEMILIVSSMNKIERLEVQLQQNLKVLERVTDSLNKHLFKEFEHKKIKIK